MDTISDQGDWKSIRWEILEVHMLLFLCRELLLNLGLVLSEKSALIPLIVENGPNDKYKLLIKRQLLDDPMIIYLQTQSEALRYKIMVIAEFEKSIAEGALGRFGPEMRVALTKQKQEEKVLRERLIGHLTLISPEVFQCAIRKI